MKQEEGGSQFAVSLLSTAGSISSPRAMAPLSSRLEFSITEETENILPPIPSFEKTPVQLPFQFPSLHPIWLILVSFAWEPLLVVWGDISYQLWQHLHDWHITCCSLRLVSKMCPWDSIKRKERKRRWASAQREVETLIGRWVALIEAYLWPSSRPHVCMFVFKLWETMSQTHDSATWVVLVNLQQLDQLVI